VCEVVLLALRGKLTKPDGSVYDYSGINDQMNCEGFIATLFGDEYHNTYLEDNICIFQLDLVLFWAVMRRIFE